MRKLSIAALLLIGANGCTSARWQVVAGPNGTVLLDSSSGQTWSQAAYLPEGESTYIPYWKSMVRGEAATRPSTGK